MIIISKQEKILITCASFFVAFFTSFFLFEAINSGSNFSWLNILYYFRNFDKALFGAILILHVISENIANQAISIIFGTIVSSIILITMSLILFLIYKIRKGVFNSILTKRFTFVFLFLGFEVWFIIGLFIPGMEKI